MTDKKQIATTESTVVWRTTVTSSPKNNVVPFPAQHQEAIFQEVVLHTTEKPVKLKIISSGFGRTHHGSSETRMQLAA